MQKHKKSNTCPHSVGILEVFKYLGIRRSIFYLPQALITDEQSRTRDTHSLSILRPSTFDLSLLSPQAVISDTSRISHERLYGMIIHPLKPLPRAKQSERSGVGLITGMTGRRVRRKWSGYSNVQENSIDESVRDMRKS